MNVLRQASRAVAQLPLALSILRHHDQDHTIVALSRILRRTPRSALRIIRSRAQSSLLGALAADALLDHSAATEILRHLSSTRPHRSWRYAIAAVATHDAALARDLLTQSTGTGSQDALARALAARESGHIDDAIRATRSGRSPALVRLRRSLTDEREALTPTGRPAHAPNHGRRTPQVSDQTRVIHLVTNALPEVQAGYTTRTHGIAAAQQRLGLQPLIAPLAGFPVTAGTIGAAEELLYGGVRVRRSLPFTLPSSATARQRLEARCAIEIAKSTRAQVVHAHSNFLNARAALAVRDALATPVVYEVRGFLEETWRSRGGDETSDFFQLNRASETEAILAADAVVTLSAGMAAELARRGLPMDRCTVIPNAVDQRFLSPPPDPASLRQRLGLTPDDLVVGSITTINAYEGLDVLLDAVALLRADGHRASALVVGSGPALADLRRQAGSGAPYVHFTGRVPFAEVHAYHAAIDVFAVPRLNLPVTSMVTPIKPLEAMATERPVVASDLAPLRELVHQGTTGLLTPAGDARALADALRTLADPDRRSTFGRAARESVLANHTWDAAARRYRDLYHGLGVSYG